MENYIWVLNCGGSFPCGIFKTKEQAEKSIKKYKLKGVLTKYPIDELIYEYEIKQGNFIPKNDLQKTSKFIGNFSSAYQEHYHYE